MAIDEAKFLEKTNNEVKNYEVMKSTFSKIHDTEMDLYRKRLGAFEEIKKIKEDDKNLKSIYDSFTEKLINLENEKEKLVTNITSKLIPSMEEFMRKVKNSKKDIGNYQSTKIKTRKQEEEKRNLDRSGNNLKGSQLEIDISRNQSIMGKMGSNIQRGIMSYEHDRINNNKLILLHFINYEMAYHAKALEELTDLYGKVKILGLEKDNGENEDDNDDDDENIKESRLSKSKKKSQKEDSEEIEENEEEEDNKNANKKSLKKSKNKSSRKEDDNEEEIEGNEEDDDDEENK